MSNFVTDNGDLPAPKTDLEALPSFKNQLNYISASDWNITRQAILDIKTYLLGNSGYGLAVASAGVSTTVLTTTALGAKGVMVTGFDASSHALDPVVYQADIVDGVSFTIRHDSATTANKFYWRT